VISESMARRYWPAEDPVGKRFGVNCAETKCEWNSIVGVVGDVKELGAAAEPVTAMYFLGTMSDMTLVVRGAQDATSLTADVRRVIRSVDPDQPIGDIRTMESILSESVGPQRLTMLVSGLFAALALLLATLGLYGVVAYSVELRRHEFGVRMALGARQQDILKMVLGQGMLVTSFGLVMGLAGALAITRLIGSLLYGVKPTDPLALTLAALALAAVAFLACCVPARRATKVDPMVALRYE
jgi:putative ABC transport system permease protein